MPSLRGLGRAPCKFRSSFTGPRLTTILIVGCRVRLISGVVFYEGGGDDGCLLLEGPLGYTPASVAGRNEIKGGRVGHFYAWVWAWFAIAAHAGHVAVEEGRVEEVVGVAVPVHVLRGCFLVSRCCWVGLGVSTCALEGVSVSRNLEKKKEPEEEQYPRADSLYTHTRPAEPSHRPRHSTDGR